MRKPLVVLGILAVAGLAVVIAWGLGVPMSWMEYAIAAVVGLVVLGWIIYFVNYVFDLMVFGAGRPRRRK